MEDRDNGGNGMICPLYFDGAVSYFHELPKPDDIKGMAAARELLNKTRSNKIFLMSYVFKTKKNNFIRVLLNKCTNVFMYLKSSK